MNDLSVEFQGVSNVHYPHFNLDNIDLGAAHGQHHGVHRRQWGR